MKGSDLDAVFELHFTWIDRGTEWRQSKSMWDCLMAQEGRTGLPHAPEQQLTRSRRPRKRQGQKSCGVTAERSRKLWKTSPGGRGGQRRRRPPGTRSTSGGRRDRQSSVSWPPWPLLRRRLRVRDSYLLLNIELDRSDSDLCFFCSVTYNDNECVVITNCC